MGALGVPLSGKIAAGAMAEQGRAIARVTDLGFGPRVRAASAADRPDAAVSEDLFRAAVAVLAAWGWALRPVAVVSIGSRTHPLLIDSLASRLAKIGRMPYLGTVEHTGPSAAARSNSAQRLRAVYGAYRLPDELATALDGLDGGPVLLVDDRTDTGWTITVVALVG